MYGLWIAALALQYSLGFLSGGLGRCVAREVAIRDPRNTNPFLAVAGYAYFLLGIGGAIVIAAAGLPLASGLHISARSISTAHLIFSLAGIGFFADQVQSLAFEVLTGLRRFLVISSLSNASVILRSAGIILLLKKAGTIVAVSLWHVTICVATAAVAYAFAIRLAPEVRPRRVSLRWTDVRDQLGFSLAGQIAAGATNILWRSAPFLLGFLKGAPAIVPYELGGKFPMSVSSISWQAAEVFFPAASEYHSAKKEEHTRHLLEIGTRGVLFVVIPLCLILIVLAPHLLTTWVGSAAPETVWIVRFVAVAVLIDGAAATCIQVIWGQGHIKLASLLTFASALLAVISACILIPRNGAQGAAIGLLAGVTLSSIGFVYFGTRHCRYSIRKLVASTLKDFTIPVVLTVGYLLEISSMQGPQGWPILAFLAASSLVVYAVVFYLFSARSTEKSVVEGVLLTINKRMYVAYQSVRRVLERNSQMRAVILYAVEIKNTLLDSSRHDRGKVEKLYRSQEDPFGFSRNLEQFRFQRAMEILQSVANGARFPRALEIGCAEGAFTRTLANRCETLVALDLSTIAIERARRHCADQSNIEFAEWDVRKDSIDGTFDLIVATGVLEYILRPSTLHDVRERITAALRPGGYLLLGNTATESGAERTWIGKRLIRGTLVNDFFAGDPRYEIVDSSLDQCVCLFAHTLLRRRRS